MDDLIYEPLKFYETDARQKHHDNAMEYFDKLVERSGMNVEENRETVKKYNEELEEINNLKKKIGKYSFLRVLAIIGIIVGVVMSIAGFSSGIWMIFVGIAAIAGCLFAIVKKLNPILKNFNEVVAERQKIADEYLAQAKAQMEALNSLFDDTDTKNLMEQSLPGLKIDIKFSVDRANLLKEQYDYVDLTDEEILLLESFA